MNKKIFVIIIITLSLLFSGFIVMTNSQFTSSNKYKTSYMDLQYGKSPDQNMNLYIPDNLNNLYSTAIIIVHGGSFCGGDKEDFNWLGEFFSSKNYITANINYRLLYTDDNIKYPCQLEDLDLAIEKVKSISKDINKEIDNFILIGYSAGGYIITQYSLSNYNPDIEISAIIGMSTLYNVTDEQMLPSSLFEDLFDCTYEENPALWNMSNPINNITSNTPPVLILHGTEDITVPYSQALSFKSKLDDYNIPSKLVSYEGSNHGLSDQEAEAIINPIIDWIELYTNK